MTGENVTLNGNTTITGDLLVPGSPSVRLNGRSSYGGTRDGTGSDQPSRYQITLNGNSSLRDLIRRTDPVALPEIGVPPAPGGTRNVAFNRPGENPGDFRTIRNLTLNGNAGPLAVPPGIYGDFTANGGSVIVLGVPGATQPARYAIQRLTLNGNSRLKVVGPVEITVANGFTFNGNSSAADDSAWLRFKVAAGGITLNGGSILFAQIVAPNSLVTLNGNSRLDGALICDRLTVNGSCRLQLLTVNQPPTCALTAPVGGTSLIAFAPFTLNATASDTDGTISRVEFFNGENKLGDGMPAAGQPSAYTFILVSGLPVGAYTLTAVATDNAGAATPSAPVSVLVTVAPNAPPQVVLTAPQSGTTLAARAALTLSATAKDSDGTIARVEFFDGASRLGEGIPAPDNPAAFTFTSTFPAAGVHNLIARATDDAGAFTDSAPVIVTVIAALPYMANFEAAEGYVAGTLSGQLGWCVGQGAAMVTDEACFAGTHSVVLPPGAAPAKIAQAFVPLAGQNMVFVDFYAKPVADADLSVATTFEVESSRMAFSCAGASGTLQAFNGDGQGGGQWLPTGFTVPLGADQQSLDWIHLTVRLDFTHKTWDLYANGNLAAVDLSFRDSTRPAFTTFAVQGHPAAATRLDCFSAATENPLFTDADRDGMDDAWETAHGLDPTISDRNGDLDGDGLTNIREYQLGLKPNDPDSDGDGLYDGDEVFWGWDALTPNPDAIAPTVPTRLTATTTTDAVNLTWQPSTDNLRVSGYIVYCNGQPRATEQPIRETHYTDAGLPQNETFSYQVQAFDFAGNLSPLSEPISVQTKALDSDGNSLPDDWEQQYFGQTGVDPNADEDGDGLTNQQEYESGSNPKDFYNGVKPTHDVLYGGRPGPAGQLAMIVRKPDGSPWPNAPVKFDITAGRRRIAAVPGGPYSYHVTVRADANGLAQAYLEPLSQ